jgi:TfoX/Sxy family transcriptional regulator of competence genes
MTGALSNGALGAKAVATANVTIENPVITLSLAYRIDEPILQTGSLTNGRRERSADGGAAQRNKSLAAARPTSTG